MKNNYTVLFDNCVILGASDSQSPIHKHCTPLFDYIKKNPIGVVTQKIKKAVKRKASNDFEPEHAKALNANLKLLKTEYVDYKEAEKILPNVQSFFSELPKLVNEHIFESKREARKKMGYYLGGACRRFVDATVKEAYRRQLHKEYPADYSAVQSILLQKMHESPPSFDDAMLITEACYLKRNNGNVIIASTDHHLSPIRLEGGIVEPFIPNLIRNQFGIECEWPSAIPKKL
jgi:hypothetical protein